MSSERDPNEPVIVVKKNGKHGGHHGGAWKVAYADFVTAMMAFFLVLWLVNQGADIKESVGEYFRDPVGFTEKSGKSVLNGKGMAIRSEQKLPPVDQRQREADARHELKEAGDSIMNALENLPKLSNIADRVEVEVTKEGLRIQLLESKDSTFFGLGSPKMSPDGISVVNTIASVLANVPYDVIVEGHTDSISFSPTNSYSNWELSSDRANTARRILQNGGVRSERFVEIRAFADNSLRYPDDPGDPRNRRVSILVLNPYGDGLEDVKNSGATGRWAENPRP